MPLVVDATPAASRKTKRGMPAPAVLTTRCETLRVFRDLTTPPFLAITPSAPPFGRMHRVMERIEKLMAVRSGTAAAAAMAVRLLTTQEEPTFVAYERTEEALRDQVRGTPFFVLGSTCWRRVLCLVFQIAGLLLADLVRSSCDAMVH